MHLIWEKKLTSSAAVFGLLKVLKFQPYGVNARVIITLIKFVSRSFTFTLWCQIRTARSLLGPVVPYPPWFFERGVFFHFLPLWFLLGPRFSVSAWWCFYEGCGCSSKGAYLLMFWRIDCVSPSLALLVRQKIVPCTWAPFQHVMVDRVFLELTLEVIIRGEVFTFHPLRFLFGARFFKSTPWCFYSAHVHNLAP